jgi:tRNA(Ile)-lysidine synthase
LHRILRGTGLTGLAGMRRTRPLSESVTLIRPLLPFTRAELLAWLAALGQPYRDDPTNRDLAITRNRLRHELLPHLAAQYNPRVQQALLRLGQLALEANEVVDRVVDALWTRRIRIAGDVVEIDCTGLSGQPVYLIREALKSVWRRQAWPEQAMGLADWEALAQMVTDPHGDVRRTFPAGIEAVSNESKMSLARQPRSGERR